MAEYLSKEDMSTGEYISRDEALKSMQYCCKNCDNYNGAMCRACNNADEMDIICDIPAADVQPVKLIQRIVQGRLNGANYTLFEAVKSNDTNTAYKMRGAIDICCEILADLRALTATDGEQNVRL